MMEKAVFAAGLLLWSFADVAAAQTDPEWGSQPGEAQRIYDEAVQLVGSGKQGTAEDLLDGVMAQHADSQRILFLRGVLERSRFSIRDSRVFFLAASKQGKSTPVGRAAWVAVLMDMEMDRELNQNYEPHFEKLRALIRQYPDELLFRWLFAIQCRTHNVHPEEACEQYEAILAQWDPGPVMANHTYANILAETLKNPAAALPFRERALSLESGSWAYQGYGNTLRALKRYKEADVALAKAVELKPRDGDYWRQWGYCLWHLEDYGRAIAAFAEAVRLNPRDSDAILYWARCLEESGGPEKAVEMYQKAADAGNKNAEPFLIRCRQLIERAASAQGKRPAGSPGSAHTTDSGRASFRKGDACEQGTGVEKNYARAIECYQKAADEGSRDALFRCGHIYERGGYGIDRDLDAAAQWYGKLAATNPNAKAATFRIGRMVLKRSDAREPEGFRVDYALTISSVSKDAYGGDQESADLLAWLYATCCEKQFRNGSQAVELAEALVRSEPSNAQWHNTLAAAYARTGAFGKAVAAQQKALELQGEGSPGYAERLELYKNNQAYPLDRE